MNSRRLFMALVVAAGVLVARGVLADPDQDYAPHDKVQPAETDVDDDSDDSREMDVDDAGDPSREVDVDDASDDSREADVDEDTEEGADSEDGPD
jgi:hypothetical protein